MHKVTVYFGNGCSACHEAMALLEANNVPFTGKNVHDDIAARKELVSLGSKTIPTTVIDDQVVVGFEADRIKQLLSL
jgi:glutaredoxin 3